MVSVTDAWNALLSYHSSLHDNTEIQKALFSANHRKQRLLKKMLFAIADDYNLIILDFSLLTKANAGRKVDTVRS